MQILASASRPAPTVLRPGRRRSILQELTDDGALVSFQGLRRRLGLHPEALRRTLRRLEEDELIEGAEGGYRATEAGQAAVAGQPRSATETHVLLQGLLPPGVDAEAVAAAMAGRWSGPLHWYGRSDGPDETTLTWIVDGRLTHLRIRAGTITIEAEGVWGRDAFPIGPLLAALSALM